MMIAVVIGWQIARGTDGFLRLVALGLVTSLFGYHVHGMADTLALGPKPSEVLWMILVLIAALANRQSDRAWQD